jgi:hypothetical protein
LASATAIATIAAEIILVGSDARLSNRGAATAARTVGSFDLIYDFGGAQLNVATAAPGDPGYNGGRWRVHALSFNSSYAETLAAHDLNDNGVIDTTAEVESALSDPSSSGTMDLGVVKSFECPVIEVPRSS